MLDVLLEELLVPPPAIILKAPRAQRYVFPTPSRVHARGMRLPHTNRCRSASLDMGILTSPDLTAWKASKVRKT